MKTNKPVVDLHVLPVEEKHRGRYERDVKVLAVDGHALGLHDANPRHS